MHTSEGVDTTGAADENLTIVLGVDIDETLAAEHAVLELLRTG